MNLRIYTYKITFDEVPFFYWGIHKESKQNDKYMGSPVTHKWMWDFYTPTIEILELFDYSDAGWEEAREVETRVIKEFLNDKNCLNEACGGFYSLDSSRKAGKLGGESRSKEKLPDGRSINAVNAGKKSGKIWTESKINSSRCNLKKATQHQKDNKLQIYSNNWEYYRRKGRLRRFGVKINGIRIPMKNLSETFIEYHLLYGIQKGGYYETHN